MDFLTDSLADGRRFRVLTIVDNVSRVSPAIEVGVSLTGERVVAVLERLQADDRGCPSGSPSTTARSSSPRRWMPGRTATGCSWSSPAPASRRTMPSPRRSTAGSGTSASINTGSRRWRRRARPSRRGGWSTTRSGPTGRSGSRRRRPRRPPGSHRTAPGGRRLTLDVDQNGGQVNAPRTPIIPGPVFGGHVTPHTGTADF